jgi:hypothetical protein
MQMQRCLLKSIGRVVLALSVGLTLALLSSLIQRFGPEELPYGNLCSGTGNELCMEPVLNGGFPIPFLFDAPGVSRERQLALVEDDLRKLPFVLDVAIYSFTLLLVGFCVELRRLPCRRCPPLTFNVRPRIGK